MMSLTLPSGEIVYDGAVLRIGDDATNYFLHYGEYTFGEATNCSWYLQAIGTSVAVPITDEMLSKATVMNNGAEVTVHTPVSGCSCHNQPNTVGYEEKEKVTTNDKYILDRTWVTVDTIIERNSLPLGVVINGRVVQVNQSEDGQPHYYRYNVKTMEWDEISLGNVDEYIEEIKESMANLAEDINTVSQNLDKHKDENKVIIESIQEKLKTIDEKLNGIQTSINSEYYTSAQLDDMLNNYYNKEEMDNIISELRASI